METDKKEEPKEVVQEKPAQSEEPKNDKFYELKKNLVLLEKASKDKDFKSTAAIAKNLKKLRKMFDLPDAVLALSYYLPDLHMRIMLPTQPTDVPADKDLESFLHCSQTRAEEIMVHAESQLFIYDLLLMKLIDDGDYKNAQEFGDFVVARLKNVNLRTLDHLGAKAMYFIAIANEKTGKLPQVRTQMFEFYKTACLRKDLIGQATITNVIIRSYLKQNLYDQAWQFIDKTNFP